jgi:hypothetical protein
MKSRPGCRRRRTPRARHVRPKGGDELRSLESQIFNECARSARLRASEHNAQSSEEDRAVGRGANRNRLVLKTDN